MEDRLEHCRAFALVELLALILIAAILAAILLPMADSARRTARLSDDLGNLGRIGTLTRSYASDFNDQMWSFSWRPGNYTTQYPDLQFSSNLYDAAGKQAVAIMRNRSEISSSRIIVVSGWVPHILYSHLVLQDYAADVLPHQMFISSGDRSRLRWSADPDGFFAGQLQPQPSPFSSAYRWVFSSSYEVPPPLYDQGTGGNRIRQGNSLHTYFVPSASTANLEGVPLSMIAHPSGKVMQHDVHARHFGKRQPSFILPEARIPLLLADGAAAVKLSADSNLAVDPAFSQASTSPYQSAYSPAPWFPAAVTGPQDIGDLRYRYTRMYSRGRDFGGPPIFP